jgi:hypothetical protein
MKLFKFLSAGAALALAAMPAMATISIYAVTLTGPSESPANASPGIGIATVTIDDVALTMNLDVSFSGLTGTTTASHIHCCTSAPGAGTAGVATTTPYFVGFPIGVTSGSYLNTFDMTLASSYNNPAFITANGGTPATAFVALLAGINAGKAYLNIHTSTFGGGEIRGFLAPAPVPEASTWATMLGGLAVVAGVLRRRRGA